MKTLAFDFCDEPCEAAFEIAKYEDGGKLAVVAWSFEDDCPEPFAYVTVNFPEEPTFAQQAFVDTNNCPKPLIDAMEKAQLMSFEGRSHKSGYVDYPLYNFDLELLSEYVLELDI